ncbi:DedA family protein [Lichenicola cladoniae]|uniref:DedA family protein n=1 Tax=Lichenicola cladoniae TaxID=1484109 RepID=A0A6M8HX73_9PROT|nr:DedA family protein [Lichenicola cladoniae]NPD67628.1 DedA family protein [Acetobacteraceae bacterium]QKE92787.1 DedA family protein [Lichenicola cladoniae]
MLERLYARTLALAATRRAPLWLALIAVAEGSFFPVPPDVLLIPMVLARRDLAWRLAGLCTLASLCGGTIGWLIGAEAIRLAAGVIHFYHAEAALALYVHRFAQYGFSVILLKGLTPIPYKIIAIAAGAAHYSLPLFLLASLITRGFRFFLLAGLLHRFGAPIQTFIERRLTILALGFAILIVAGILVAVRV